MLVLKEYEQDGDYREDDDDEEGDDDDDEESMNISTPSFTPVASQHPTGTVWEPSSSSFFSITIIFIPITVIVIVIIIVTFIVITIIIFQSKA